MSKIMQWLKKHGYEAHLLAFALMVIPSFLLYFSARQSLEGLTWALLATVVGGNLIALSVK